MVFFLLNIRILRVFGSLPFVKQMPTKLKIHLYIIAYLLFVLVLSKVSHSLIYLFMDELSKAILPFYPSMSGAGGFVQPPAPDPDNSFLFSAPPSQEAGPSEPNSHALSEARERLQRLREENLQRLREQEKLIHTAKEELQRLEEKFQAMKARDAAKDEEGRIWRQKILELSRKVRREMT